MKIYSNNKLQNNIEAELYENEIYYLDFEDASNEKVQEEIKNSNLTEFIDWQCGNRYAKLQVNNYIGNIYFFGQNFDLKSPKFLLHLSGKEQFQEILLDLQNRSTTLTFSYHSPSISIRETDFSVLAEDIWMQFNYFKQIILDWPQYKNLDSDFLKILKNPHFMYQHSYKETDTTKIKKISNKTIQKLISQQKTLVPLESSSDLKNLPISCFLSQGSEVSYFPSKLYVKNNSLTVDTNENRFLKFFFEYIQNIALRLNQLQKLPIGVLEEQRKVLAFCRQILANPFFKDIGKLYNIPENSTVLRFRSGYKEIFEHYTNSRFGVKTLFDQFQSELLSQGLKKISHLYEYWTFFIIAEAFLGKEFVIDNQETIIESGKIANSVCFKKDEISVYYNRTQSRGRNSSYSLNFRPDIMVEINKGYTTFKCVFDAKYRVEENKKEDEIARFVKPEDIHKMHAYLDAISNVNFAMVIYPGTEFYFYEKNYFSPIRRNVKDINVLNGVGAIPLIPSDLNSELKLKEFVEKVKSCFS